MKSAIVVGQSNANKCLVAKFSESSELWTVDTTFPDIIGVLWGVYAKHSRDIWVAGGSGVLGTTSPILYHYIGSGVWVDYSSSITDAIYFTDIDGSDTDNIWAIGSSTGIITTGTWNWDGTNWSSTKTNTIDFTTWSGDHPHISVSEEGNAYTCSTSNVFSNVSVSTWSQLTALAVNRFHHIHAISDLEIYGSVKTIGNALITYNGSWSYYKQPSPVSGTCWQIGVLESEELFFVDSVSVGEVYRVTGGVPTLIGNAGTIPTAEDDIKLAYLDTGDLWVCGPKYAGTWVSTPILIHYETGTTWSNPTDYNVNSLNASLWKDIYVLDPPPPHLISEPVSPNPGYYLDTPMTWKLGQD